MLKILSFLSIFFFFNCANAQTIKNQKLSSDYEFIAKIKCVDTVLLMSDEYISNSIIPVEEFKIISVKFETISEIKTGAKKIPDLIILKLKPDEHGCLFDFQKGKVYKIYGKSFRYLSKSVRKKYRQPLLQLDCSKDPELQ